MADSAVQASQPAFPRIKEPAPSFEARTTHGMRKLSDYAGVHHRIHRLCPGLPRVPEAQL